MSKASMPTLSNRFTIYFLAKILRTCITTRYGFQFPATVPGTTITTTTVLWPGQPALTGTLS